METLVEATRGKLVESRHRGIIALVDTEGKLLSSVGDVEQYVFMRSSAKPLQLIPLIESGAADHFQFTDKELAVMMASHSGEPFHIEAVRSILAKIGLHEGALLCGTHWPLNKEVARQLICRGQEPTAIHNNCSGKHAAMLALAVYGGHSVTDYISPDHPVQIQIRTSIADFAGLTPEQIKIGTDGCGVPVFGLPLWRAAYAYARLVSPANWPSLRREACRRIIGAMQRHPEMIAGTGQFNTDLIRIGGPRLVAKGGAEGYYAVGVLPTDHHPGLGLTLKIEDGDLQGRASGPVILSCLQQIDVLQEDDIARLKSHWPRSIYNHRGEVVGKLRTTFVLLPSGAP